VRFEARRPVPVRSSSAVRTTSSSRSQARPSSFGDARGSIATDNDPRMAAQFVAIVRRQQDARDGDVVVALVGGAETADEATVKTFHREGDGRIRLQPERARSSRYSHVLLDETEVDYARLLAAAKACETGAIRATQCRLRCRPRRRNDADLQGVRSLPGPSPPTASKERPFEARRRHSRAGLLASPNPLPLGTDGWLARRPASEHRGAAGDQARETLRVPFRSLRGRASTQGQSVERGQPVVTVG
jgi:hypothetical protein